MEETSRQPKKRPFGLFIIIGLQLIEATLLILGLMGEKSIIQYLRVLVQNPIFYSWFGWVLVAVLLLAVVGLLFLKRWGWILSMIMTGIGLAYAIWSYTQGDPHYLPMVIYLVIVFYLNQRDVQAPFVQFENPVGVR